MTRPLEDAKDGEPSGSNASWEKGWVVAIAVLSGENLAADDPIGVHCTRVGQQLAAEVRPERSMFTRFALGGVRNQRRFVVYRDEGVAQQLKGL
jgi:hypothetical protein